MYLKRVLVSQVLCNNIMKTDWKQICWIVSRLIVQSQSMFCILRKVSLHTGENWKSCSVKVNIYMRSVSVRDNTLQTKCSSQRIQQAANQSLQRIGHSLQLQRIQQVANIASSESPLPSSQYIQIPKYLPKSFRPMSCFLNLVIRKSAIQLKNNPLNGIP